MRVLGLDEAGRGSVLGPMAIGCFCCQESEQDDLRQAGAADSKALTARRRGVVRGRLAVLGQGSVRLVSAAEIDAENINSIEERVFIELIAEHRPDRVYIDAPVHPRGIAAFTARVLSQLPDGLRPDMVVEPKADVTWPVVGAASIFAKLARDEAVAALREQLGPVGSGYPSDPKTRAFISDYLDREAPLPACVRSRWGTIENLRQQRMFKG